MKPYEINNSDIQVFQDQKLGQGGFGAVYKGRWSGRDVAIKVLVCKLTGDVEKDFRQELAVMLGLRSPQVVQTFGGILAGPTQAIVMELMPRGSLYGLLREEKPLDWPTKYRIALDVAYGIKYLHGLNILHRDLKSLNVLLDEKLQAKLCDFGLAAVKTASQSLSTQRDAVGTLLWMAPELFGRKAKFSELSDIYARGMVLYELLTHQAPFESDLQGRVASIVSSWVSQGERPDLPEKAPAEFKRLIERCWAQEVGSRPVAVKVVEALEPLVSEEVSQSMADLNLQSGPNYQWDSEVGGSAQPSHLPTTTKKKQRKQAGLLSRGLFQSPLPVQAPKLDQEAVEKLLLHVARGEQDEAEAMLKENKALALGKGRVKDYSERIFEDISPFQYALWAQDWCMWRMIQQYLPQEAQREQLEAILSKQAPWVSKHGPFFDLQPLIDVLKTYVSQYDHWSYDQCEDYWCKTIGGLQRLLPVQVINEYCRGDRSFDPTPDFTDPTELPRRGYVDKKSGQEWGVQWWFTHKYDGGLLVGEKWAGWRGMGSVACNAVPSFIFEPAADRTSLDSLSNARHQQIEALVESLHLSHAQSPRLALK